MTRRQFIGVCTTGVIARGLTGTFRGADKPSSALNTTPFMDLASFGATGNGLVDDTTPINRALTAAARLGVRTVYGAPDATYLIASAVDYQTFCVPSGTTTKPVCILIPSGVTLDLRGSTMRLREGLDAVMVSNAGAARGAVDDHDLGLVNATLDGNHVRLTQKALLWFFGVQRPTLSIKMRNVVGIGIQLYAIESGRFPSLDVANVVGAPIAGGQNTPAGLEVRGSYFGKIVVEDVVPDPFDAYHRPGNSLTGVFKDCNFDLIQATNCAAGIKLEEPSADVTINQVVADRCGDSGGNSGLKLQGQSTSRVQRIAIGNVVMTNQQGPGLWFEYTEGCSVKSYSGINNNSLGTGPDVWLGGLGDYLGEISSAQCGGDAVYVRAYSSGVALGYVVVSNPGRTAGSASKVAMRVEGQITCGSVTAIDDQPRHTMRHGLTTYGTKSVLKCPLITVSGALSSAWVGNLFGQTIVTTEASTGGVTTLRAS